MTVYQEPQPGTAIWCGRGSPGVSLQQEIVSEH
nr:MAG TPA_asm: hypothetical protein [Caudoviricetes sp.]